MKWIQIMLFVGLLLGILMFVVKDHSSTPSRTRQPLGSSPNTKCNANSNTNDDNAKCHSCSAPGGGTLLPVMEPLYNMREICKQSILLEDHLFQTKKRCEDCITKHMLTIEALAEEAITLDKEEKCKEFHDLPDKIRELEREYMDQKNASDVAQKFRKIRKSLMLRCRDAF